MPKFSEERIRSAVSEVIQSVVAVEANEVTPDANLIEDLGCDSLDRVEIIMALEEEFGIAIDDDKADEFTFVRDITGFLMTEVGQ